MEFQFEKEWKDFIMIYKGVCPKCREQLDIMRHNGIQIAFGMKDYQNCPICNTNYYQPFED